MRNPNDAYRDTLNKLVFIYPFGIDQSIANTSFQTFVKGDSDTIGDLTRAFFSVSILKEIFSSNALNLITLASTYDRFPKKQDTSKKLIGSLLRGDATRSYEISFSSNDDREIPPVDQSTLQSKVNDKVREIKQLLKSDPKLKRLNSFMQVITLQNMLDVPVITGTWPFQLDTAAIFTLLAAAISTRSKLTDWSTVRSIFSKLHNMPDESVYNIFEVLQNIEINSGIPGSISSTMLPGGIPTEYEELNSKLMQEENPAKKKELQLKINTIKQEYSRRYVSNLKDTKMKELERAFMYMLDPERLLVKFGMASYAGQAEYAKKRVMPQTDLLFNRTRQQFVDFFAGADVLFSSAYMLFSPAIQSNAWGTNYLSLKEQSVNSLVDSFDIFFRNLRSEFDVNISQNIESSSLSIQNMKRSCDVAKEEFISVINYFHKTIGTAQVPPSFSLSHVQQFSNSIDAISAKFSPIKKNIEDSLSQFFGRDNMVRVSSAVSSLVNNTVDNFFTPFRRTASTTTDLQARLYSINLEFGSDSKERITEETHNKLLTILSLSTKLILETTLLLIFKLNLCDFVDVADVEFDVAKNDALDLPNYCLVLPLEILQALFVLYTKRQWKDAVIRSGQGFNPLNSSNIKGVMRTFCLQLGIPNLMIIDKKKSEIYYSFKYLNNMSEKLKVQAVETFVKHHLQNDNLGISQVYY